MSRLAARVAWLGRVVLRLPLLLRVVTERLHEDPYRLAALVLLRLPAGARRAAGRLLRRVPGAPVVRLLGCWAGEDRAALDRAAGAGLVPRAAAHAAVVLLAVGETDLAARVLPDGPDGPDGPHDGDGAVPAAASGEDDALLTSRARLAWGRGRLDAALALLAARRHPAAAPARSLAAERRVLVEPWPAFAAGAVPLPSAVARRGPHPAPSAAPASTARGPGAPRALHLLTNSLPTTRSGYAYRSHEVLRAQRAAGVDAVALTRLGYPVVTGSLGAPVRDVVDGVHYRRDLPQAPARDPWARLLQQAEHVARAARAHRADVLHTTTHFVNAMAVAEAAQRLGVPWVYEVRGLLEDTWRSTQPDGAERTDRYRWSREREGEAMRAADAVVTLSAGMAAEVVARGVPAERVLLAPNAVPAEVLGVPTTDAAATRARLGVPGARLVLGTATSVVPYEGLDTAVRALPLLVEAGVDAHLLVAGDGTALAGLRALADGLGLQGRTTFLGRVPKADVLGLVDAMDVFVVPRRDDPVCRVVTPLKPLEAMARGVPVVASDLPALREVVDDGRTGLLAPPEDPVGLAAALTGLAGDPARREELGTRSRAWVEQERTWAANGVRYRTLYDGLLGRSSGGTHEQEVVTA